MKYAGLTDDPVKRKEEHGNPVDWRVEKTFASEEEARKWAKGLLALGYRGGPGGAGWKFGYTYTITEGTRQ